MKVNHLFTLVLLAGCMASCSDALYRSFPKADKHHGEASIPEQKERKHHQVIVPDEVLHNEEAAAVTPVGKSPETVVKTVVAPKSEAEEESEATQRAMEAVPATGDTIEVEQDEQDQMIYEAEKSERLVRQLRGWASTTLLGLIFFPLFFIGLIGGIVTIVRYNRLTYVSERSIEAKRKAQNFFIAAVVIPLSLIALIYILIYLSF